MLYKFEMTHMYISICPANTPNLNGKPTYGNSDQPKTGDVNNRVVHVYMYDLQHDGRPTLIENY